MQNKYTRSTTFSISISRFQLGANSSQWTSAQGEAQTKICVQRDRQYWHYMTTYIYETDISLINMGANRTKWRGYVLEMGI